jgi:RNA polymerase sigma-B factor
MRADAVLAWTPMAYRLARMYAVDHNIREDLRQTAVVGLIKAVDGFDPAWGADFVGYAVPTIRGELKRYFRDRHRALRAPRRLHDLYQRIQDADRHVVQPLGRLPTVTDIAAYVDAPVEQVLEALQCARARRMVSLSEPGSQVGTELADTIGAEDDGYRMVEQHLDLCHALLALDEREQSLVTLYFYGNRTQSEIGRDLGLSQMHISRLLRRALEKLRRSLAVDQ